VDNGNAVHLGRSTTVEWSGAHLLAMGAGLSELVSLVITLRSPGTAAAQQRAQHRFSAIATGAIVVDCPRIRVHGTVATYRKAVVTLCSSALTPLH
jgi:hypothetical protein